MTIRDRTPAVDPRHRIAFLDWMACAVAGNAADTYVAVPGTADGGIVADVVALGTAGHVLDFDDTYVPGLSHLSAATAPAAVVLAKWRHATVGQMLAAYARGFEAMARFSAASHPALYDAGWHPTSVCGTVGAAVTAAGLLELDDIRTRHGLRLGLLGASGLLSAFGSHGKSVQVGLAAANGVLAAQLAGQGAVVPAGVERGPGSFAEVYGGDVSSALDTPRGEPEVARNWIKAYPCCLQTHGPVDAGLAAADEGVTRDGSGIVTVHPVSRQAAGYDDAANGLEAKFSITYTTAWAILRGAPTVRTFDHVDDAVRELARRITVHTDPALDPNACTLTWRSGSDELTVRVDHPLGSPARPMSRRQHAAKVADLSGTELMHLLDDLDAPATEVARVLDV